MNATGSLFSQILSLFQRSDFARHVRDLKSEFRAKGFSSWDQFVAMLFCQLGQTRSLREITDGLLSCEGKLKHLGLRGHAPRRSTLSYANRHRPWQLYQRLFYDLLEQCQAISPKKKFRFRNRLLTLDSSMIELCASMYDWAHFTRTKGAIKMFAQGLAREVGGRGITVNNIQPGPIDTDLNPASGDWAVPQKANTALNRYGEVDDVAALVAFVAGPEAPYITGSSLTVDGGTNA